MASMRRWKVVMVGVRIRRSSCVAVLGKMFLLHLTKVTFTSVFMPPLISADAQGTEARIGLPL